MDLSNKVVLELGCGSGLISMQIAMQKSAHVHASDINPQAIKGLEENCKTLKIPISIYQSDLFSNIPLSKIDYLLINPPFFNKDVKSVDEFGFYTGKDYAYFHNLFTAMRSNKYVIENTLMILTDKCEIEQIREIATNYNITFKKIFSTQKFREQHFIYVLT